MTNKKPEVKRLVIFLLLAFGISWIPAIIYNKVFGYSEWFETNKMPLLSIPVAYGPAIANIITRLLTKEGWHDSMLHLRLKGNIKYYITAVIAALAMRISENITATVIYGGGDWSDIFHDMNAVQITGGVLYTLAVIPLMAFNTFGEEFGWRAYMNQKMEPLIGTAGTVIAGGIIWGLWHAELTVEGHNFGTDYTGYPYTGILFMCVFCTFTGAVLMWLTKKTGSVYPAAIMHASINFGSNSIGRLFLSGISEDMTLSIADRLIISIPSFVICSVFFALLIKKSNDYGS